MGKPRNKQQLKKLTSERIDILFKEAQTIFTKDPERSNRYVHLARRLAMKANLRLRRSHKRQYCKHCYRFLQPGVNSTTRIRDRKIIIYCKDCKKYTRIPIQKKT